MGRGARPLGAYFDTELRALFMRLPKGFAYTISLRPVSPLVVNIRRNVLAQAAEMHPRRTLRHVHTSTVGSSMIPVDSRKEFTCYSFGFTPGRAVFALGTFDSQPLRVQHGTVHMTSKPKRKVNDGSMEKNHDRGDATEQDARRCLDSQDSPS